VAKLERLLNLTAALLETERPLTAVEIQGRISSYPEAHASFRRAFERDKDDLREMGVPIALEFIPGSDPPMDGYRIRKEDYYLRDPGLEPDELAALHLAAKTVRIDGLSGAEALRKLGGVGTAPDTEFLASVPSDPRLATLFSAVTNHTVLGFAYGGTHREVEPWRLDLVRGRWYLSGFDRTRDGERHFRLDRLQSEIELLTSEQFERNAAATGVRLQPWELGDEAPQIAQLLVDPDQAAWATHHVGTPVETRSDGSVVIEVAVTNEQAFRSFVLTFLEHAEVLGPLELRHSLIEWLEGVAGIRP